MNMKKYSNIMGKVKKAQYLTKSFLATLQQEGIVTTIRRLYYFIRFGKGVISKKDYVRHIKEYAKKPTMVNEVLDCIDQSQCSGAAQVNGVIDIIIPVYNGFEYLEPLFESLFKGTLKDAFRLIIVDDFSSDERVFPFLEKIRKENDCENTLLFRNRENIGFVQTVNMAVKKTKNHFVVLNTDTEVPKGWLNRLMQPIVKSNKIASTTPFTNAGTIFSFPHFLKDNEILEKLSVNEIDAYFQKIRYRKEIEVPTGMGFCMGFNKHVVDIVGMFDEKIFSKGYGEENDWCQRAMKAGYKNIVVPNLFVYHKHGGSFPSEEKKKLIKENLKKLNEKHPGYDKQVQKFIKKDPLKKLRELLVFLITANRGSKPVLIFDHELGGGANDYRKNLVQNMVSQEKKVLVLSYNLKDKSYYLRYFYKEYQVFYRADHFEEVVRFLEYIPISQIILSQIVSFEDPMYVLEYVTQLKKKQACLVKFLVHDYFCICPSYNLLNQDQKYCSIPRMEVCRKCLQTNKGQFRLYIKEKNIDLWRRKWEEFLKKTDEIICFSQSSRNIILKAYPNVRKDVIQVVPHVVDYINEKIVGINNSNIVHIGILGGINLAKGSKIIEEMAWIIDKEKINAKIIIIGPFTEKNASKNIFVHGKYDQREIVDLVKKYKIDIFFIPSIWPETFSYTTEEIMQMNMPLAVFDLGAPAERVKNYEKGKVLSEMDAKKALKEILEHS